MKRLLVAFACAAATAFAQDTLAVNPTFLWNATEKGDAKFLARVITGSPDTLSGWWHDFTDNNDGGTSYIQFPADVEIFQDGLEYGYMAEYYGGLDLKVLLGEGYEYPFAGFGFNIWNMEMKGADISAWDGFCLSYKSTLDFSIELTPEDEKDLTGHNNHKAKVEKSASIITVDVPWEKFEQESGWGKEADIGSVLAKTAAVKFIFSDSAGTKGDFLFQKVGSYGMCGDSPDRIVNGPVAVPVKATLSGRMLEFTGATALTKASVVDLQGNVVISAAALGAMDLSMLPSGIYMLRIDGPAMHHSQKIVLK